MKMWEKRRFAVVPNLLNLKFRLVSALLEEWKISSQPQGMLIEFEVLIVFNYRCNIEATELRMKKQFHEAIKAIYVMVGNALPPHNHPKEFLSIYF